MNAFLIKATNWFVSHKDHNLKGAVETSLDMIRSHDVLDDPYRKLLGFILFDFAMHYGPACFGDAERTADEIGVTTEFKEYAQDWLEHSKSRDN